MPSAVEDRPGLLIRDSLKYSDAVLIIPPPLVPALACFDGEHTKRDLHAELARVTGSLEAGELTEHLCSVLEASGLLDNHVFQDMRAACQREFTESPVRKAAHAGTAYPDTKPELQSVMAQYLARTETARLTRMPVAIAAPHVSPEGGWECYRAAYAALPDAAADRTFVILGTSHYGEPDRFGLTAKPFQTPYGTTQTAPDLLKLLEAQPAAKHEDYCHSVEHSIEFQVVFLQSIYGADIRVLPILVGSFGRSIYEGRQPETNENVARFFDALSELHSRERDRLLWVLGVDMAHMGRRYGDAFPALADQDRMCGVALRDRARMERLNAGDPRGFWDLIQQNRDDLKWCGSAPLYTFLKAVPEARGTLHKYEQWNIDPESIVSFAGITFEEGSAPSATD
jgi:AmmeMemoRadiSam system protein B